MQNLQYSAALKATIEWLESEQSSRGEQLLERTNMTLDTLKPINLLKSTVKEVVSSSDTLDQLVAPMIGLIAGNLMKKAVVNKSENPTRQVVASMLQLGVTKLIVEHRQEIKIVGQTLWEVFFKRKPKPSNPE